MNCEGCGAEVIVNSSDEGTNSYSPVDGRIANLVVKYKIPFYCVICGMLDFKYKATGDKVFLWQDPPPEYLGSLVIPDKWKDNHRTGYGTVLSVGPGCLDKSGKFVRTDIAAGDRVFFDNSVPWGLDIIGVDGQNHYVRIMGALDVKCKVTDE